MKKLSLSLLALLAAALTACGPQGPGPEIRSGPIQNALAGEFGGVAANDGDATIADLTRHTGGGWRSLNIILTAPEADGGAVMGGVFVSNLVLESLEPGTRIRATKNYGDFDAFPGGADIAVAPEPNVEITDPRGAPISVGDDVWIDGIGCSGDRPSEWTEDEPAEEIIIDIVIDEEGTPGVVVSLDFATAENNLKVIAPLTGITEFQDDFIGEPMPMPAERAE